MVLPGFLVGWLYHYPNKHDLLNHLFVVAQVTHFSCAEIVGYEGTRGKLSRASKARDGVKDVDVWQSTKTFEYVLGVFFFFVLTIDSTSFLKKKSD